MSWFRGWIISECYFVKISKGFKYVITFLLAMNFLVFGQDYENDDVLIASMTQKECRTQNWW